MIHVDLPGGVTDPLVRGLAACLSSVTEVTLADIPAATGLSVPAALAVWKSWLAGRNSGLVPIADPRAFQWAGWWLAVVEVGATADGTAPGQVAVLAFGTPPGVVLSPQDPALLGRPTADMDISSAYAVASLDPSFPPSDRARC